MNRLAVAIAIYFTHAGFCAAEIVEKTTILKQEAFLEHIISDETLVKGESSLNHDINLENLTPYSVSDENIPSLLTEITLSSASGFGDSFSIGPLVGDTLESFFWVSTIAAPTTHVFDGSNESGGGNFFGTSGGSLLVLEGIFPQGGGVDRYVVEVRATNSSSVAEPWIDASWTGQNLDKWRLDVGTSAGGGNPLSPGFDFSVMDSGFFAFDSSDAFLGAFDLYADFSTTVSLAGSARLNNGGSDIAGVDVAAIQLYWDILPAPADLDLQFVDAINGTYLPGDTVEVHNITKNIGITVSNAYTITFYASINLIISEADIPLGFVNRSALDPDASHNNLTKPTIPSNLPWGNYYIGAILTVADANPANNINVDPTPITVTTPTDLSLLLIDAEEGTYTPGSQISILTNIQNVDGTTSADYSISYYASSDSNITSGDSLIGNLNLPALNPLENYFGNVTGPLPNGLSDGLYYIGAILNISDTNASNNINYDPTKIRISSNPDIQIRPLMLNFTEETQSALATISKSDQLFSDYKLRHTFQANLFEKANRDGLVRVIVGLETPFRPEGMMAENEQRTQRQGIDTRGRQLLDSLQGFNFKENARYHFIPFVALTVDEHAFEHLINSPLVTSVEEDSLSAPMLSTSNQVIGSPLAWAEGFDGSGQTIAILDDGVDKTHPWFTTGGAKVVSEACYSSNNPEFSTSLCPGGVESSTAVGSGVSCLDECYHGTHVAGIAAGNDGSGPGFGVARNANIIAIQVFSEVTDESACGGSAPCLLAFKADQISALERVYAIRGSYDIAAVNMSLGGEQYFNQASCDAANPSSRAAIDTLRSVDIATVISSGNNSFKDSIGSPACISTAISVGNTRRNDEVSGRSNIYAQIHLLAPGTDIVSSFPGTGTEAFTGTSMSAPHVAGAWAVMKQVFPNATVDEILSKFQNTATLVNDSRFGGTETNMPRINLDLAIGEPRTTFGIFNTDPAALNITSISPEISAPWISWSPDAPFDIPANQMRVITVTIDYALAPAGVSQTRLLINSNDPDESPYPNGVLINVTKAQSAEPEFSSTPAPDTTLEFGNTVTGTTSDPKLVTVDNLGTADLTLSCNITGSNADQFNLIACTSPVTPAGSTNISVTCEPGSVGSKQASLDVTTNDVEESAVSYALTCTGIEPPPEDIIFRDSFEN